MAIEPSSAPERIGVVVVTRNRKPLLRRCLTALRAQTLPPGRILVVDNGSSDGTPAMLLAEFPEADRLRFEDNIGGAGGFHEGMRALIAAGSEWIWTMDDDCYPEPDALKNMARAAEEGSVYVSATLSEAGDGEFACRAITLKRGAAEVRITNSRELGAGVAETTGIGLGGLFISRETVARVGLPRTDFFIYADDSEYSRRIRLRYGIRTFCVPDSVILHPPVPLKTVRLLWRDVNFVPAPLWKTYYNVRNQVYVARLYSRGALGFYAFYLPKQLGFLFLRAFFLDEDEKFKRFFYYMTAVFDGVTGRLGKREFNGGKGA